MEQRSGLESVRDSLREGYSGRLLESKGAAKECTGRSGCVRGDQQPRTCRRTRPDPRRTGAAPGPRAHVGGLRGGFEAPAEPLPQPAEDDAEIERTIEMLRERLRRVGEVNMAAFEDFETESARLKELTAQRDDLQKRRLTTSSRRYGSSTRRRGRSSSPPSNRCRSTLPTCSPRSSRAARPRSRSRRTPTRSRPRSTSTSDQEGRRCAGSRCSRRASGRSRPFRAVRAHLVKPSAYCILDELDAPLDEANTVRFLNVVRKFSADTQFIVITHNKRRSWRRPTCSTA